MLKIQRNSVYILLPFCIISLIVSALLNAFTTPNNSWITYSVNISIGIFGSSLLALILAIIGYNQEKHLAFEEYFRKLEKMISSISKYQKCEVTDEELLKTNLTILQKVLFEDVHELGDIYAKFAFIWDRQKVKPYLFGFYQYFSDIQELVSDNIRLLRNDVRTQSVLDFIDMVLLEISTTTYKQTVFTEVKNKIVEDLNGELDTLIMFTNRKKDRGMKIFHKYKFNKTVLDDKIFKIESNDYENILHNIIAKIGEEKEFTIHFTDLTNENLDYLRKNEYVCGTTTTKKGKLTSITATDKAYRYFEYKKRFEMSKKI